MRDTARVPPQYHVLLIGIDAYQGGAALNGCVNDIDLVQRLLIDRVGVPVDRIVRLAAPRFGSVHETDVSDVRPTLENLRKAFAELGSERVAPGDRVFIYYSGHGTQCKIVEGAATYVREALLPVDNLFLGQARFLFDWELNAMLAQIAARTTAVTFVLDCCCSGGVTRGELDPPGTRVRYWPTEEPYELPPERQPPPAASPRGLSNGVVGSVRACQIVTACLDDERARESLGESGQSNGELTRAFVQQVEGVRDCVPAEIRWGRIWRPMLAQVAGLNAAQHPWIAGGYARRVFAGLPENGDMGYGIRLGESGSYQVEAGSLAGVTEGAELAVYGSDPAELPALGTPEEAAARKGRVRVTSATRGSAEAVSVAGPFELPPGARGRLVLAGRAARLRVALSPHDAGLAAGLALSPLLELVTGGEPAELTLVKRADGGWALTDEVFGAGEMPGEPVLATIPASLLDRAALAVEHYYRYSMPLRLAKGCQDLPRALRLRLLDCNDMGAITPAQAQNPSHLPDVPRPLPHDFAAGDADGGGDRICILVHNDSELDLRVTLVGCFNSGRVVVLSEGEIPRGGLRAFWDQDVLGQPLRLWLADGRRIGLDRIAVIGTTNRGATLHALEQTTSFADVLDPTKLPKGTGSRGTPPTEMWTATVTALRMVRDQAPATTSRSEVPKLPGDARVPGDGNSIVPRPFHRPKTENAMELRYHVLLIGIDAYASHPLNGCVNDIDAIQRILLTRAKIPAESIRRLASPNTPAKGGTAVAEAPATLANIRAALAELGSANVGPKDRVIVYYSGHGARLPVTAAGGRFEREALVPVDFDTAPGELQLLFDFELNRLLAAIAARTPAVTVVLDCCHSTGVPRLGLPRPGQKTRRIELEKAFPRRATVTLAEGLLPTLESQARGVGNVDSCLIVAACLNHELAQEDLGDGDEVHGLLTRALTTQLAAVHDDELRSVPWSRVWQKIRADVQSVNRQQHPWMAGSAARELLAGPPVEGDPGFPLTRAVDDAYAIEAGTLAGITEGARLAVYAAEPAFFPALGSDDDTAARWTPTLLTVTRAERSRALARADGPAFDPPNGARARLVERGTAERLACALVPNDEAVAAALAASPLLRVTSAEEATARLEEHDGSWLLTDDVHCAKKGYPVLMTLRPDELGFALPLLEHYAAYAAPLQMAARCTDLPGALQVHLLACPEEGLPEAEAQSPTLPESPAHAAFQYGLELEDTFCVRVRNTSTRRLRVTLLDCTASGKVQLLGDQIIEPRSHFVFWLSGALGVPFAMKQVGEATRYIDRFVAIGTTAIEKDVLFLQNERRFGDIVPRTRGGSRDIGEPATRAAAVERWTATVATVAVGVRAEEP